MKKDIFKVAAGIAVVVAGSVFHFANAKRFGEAICMASPEIVRQPQPEEEVVVEEKEKEEVVEQ